MREELGVPEKAPVLGMIARLHPVKDHATFLSASEILVHTKPKAHFVLCGRDVALENDFFARALAKHPLRQHVHLLGERRDIPHVLNGLDIFTVSSTSEGFPNVVGEAMACGIPCVVTNTAGDAPVVVGETGMAIPPQNPQALAKTWETMITMGRQARQHLGQSARQRIERYYNLPNIIADYQRLYESLVKS